MSNRVAYSYAVLRLVPDVQRGECLNVGVALFCRARRFLDVCFQLDDALLHALSPGRDPAPIRAYLEALARIAAGDPDAGPLAALDQSERFHWLTNVGSTMLQPGPIHGGITDDPEAELDHLMRTFVLRPKGGL